MNAILYLDFVGRLSGIPTDIRKPRLAALLRAVGLLAARSQKVQNFSTGMTTRLGIAASLMNDPDLLIWDEPTAGLDPEGRKYTIDLIQELGQEKTILVSSHNLADIQKVCDYIGILSDGKLIFSGRVEEMTRFTRTGTIELELEGDVEGLCRRLETSTINAKWERTGMAVRLRFERDGTMAAELGKVLQLVNEANVTLYAIHSLQDEMVEAFIQLLEAERAHGFSRILKMDGDTQTANDGVLGADGS
jgi:ABC-2 type transport system ATP-binding protein